MMVLCQAESLSNQSTISNLAWEPYKFLIKDGIFMTKDIEIIKAKLFVFDYYFLPDIYCNRYVDELMSMELDMHDLKAQISDTEISYKKFKRRMRVIVPITFSVALLTGFILGSK